MAFILSPPIAPAAMRAAAGGHQPSTICSAGTAAKLQQPTSVLEWLVASKQATPSHMKVERTFMGPNLGWGLVATADIAGEETILSVPLTSAITSEGVPEAEWSIGMADRLLQGVHDGSMQPWVDCLPRDVFSLPWLHWDAATVAELQDPGTLEEVYKMQGVLEQALERLPQHSSEDVAWALSMVHSRSFISSGTHVWVPGVDLCNHDLARPSATVKCTHSPDTCQGAAATEEIAPLHPSATQPSTFELIAGETGVRAGEEVSISYGSWPNDVFLLFFGFVPVGSNLHDSVVLFNDLWELAAFATQLAGLAFGREAGECDAAVKTLEQELGKPADEFDRLVVTGEGLDGRLLAAADAAARLLLGGQKEPSPISLIAARCQMLLDSYSTTLEEDEIVLSKAEGPLTIAIQYRAAKKQVLQAALRCLNASII